MEREVVKVGLDLLVNAEQSNDGDQDWILPIAVVASVGLIAWLFASLIHCLPAGVQAVVRRAGWIVLHLADYFTNIVLMVVLFMTGHREYLFILVPTHLLIGCLCAYSALKSTDLRSWPGPYAINVLFVIIVWGLMQGIQIKISIDDYKAQKALEDQDDDEEAQTAPKVVARYHLKAFDGVVEAFVFASVALHALLGTPVGDELRQWSPVLYLTAFLCFLSSGLSLMEIDVRSSISTQDTIQQASLNRVRHLAFRSSEFATRLVTILAFITFMASWRQVLLGNLVLLLDYVIGVGLLVHFGGHDPCWVASLILGVPLAAVNVMQFVDAPGMSFPAQKITSIIVPLRILETAAVAGVIYAIPGDKDLPEGYNNLLDEFAAQPEWLVFAAIALVFYLFLLFCYACVQRRSADLHTVVAAGDAEAMEKLLSNEDVVLDVNRYGTDGRTPLHLACALGKLDCITLLLEHGAKLNLRTNIKPHFTTLHLAAKSNEPDVVRQLCSVKDADDKFVNEENDDGDTALHIAAKHQHVDALHELLLDVRVDFKIKNKKGQTADECAYSEKFAFERNSSEHAIAELFKQAQDNRLEGRRDPKKTIEMATQSSSRAGAAITPEISTLKTGEETEVDDPDGHEIPLMTMQPTEERRLMNRTGGGDAVADAGFSLATATNVGLSTFMLSAGLGALSLAFTTRVVEQNNDAIAVDQPDVKTKLDDFAEIKAVGEGAFGKVVMVKHKETGEIFAMKLMDKAKFKAQKITRKAHSEQFILKTTRHPFVVSLHYAFQGSTFWALVMDFCPNGDLQKLLVDYGSPGLPFKETARYAGEVLLAIEHLHSIRVIFRDLKLENVVIDTKWRARVTDFGLAKKLQTEADAKTMCGSYGYAAPEIMMNTGRYTYAVDLYSFGVMLYMMVSGGEESTKKKQRLPPVRHSALRRKLREAEKANKEKWVSQELGAHELLMMLTAENAADRTTASKVKEHRFFEQQLGRPVKSLLSEEGPFTPPQKPAKQERASRR